MVITEQQYKENMAWFRSVELIGGGCGGDVAMAGNLRTRRRTQAWGFCIDFMNKDLMLLSSSSRRRRSLSEQGTIFTSNSGTFSKVF